VKVIIPGEPCAQGRGRAAVVNGRAHIFDPKKSRSWKGAAQCHMQEAMGDRKPFTGALQIFIKAVFTCPKSDYKKTREVPERWHTKRGDIDNVVKAVLDAGNGVLWLDDAQVCSVSAQKVIAAQGEPPNVVVRVRELDWTPEDDGGW